MNTILFVGEHIRTFDVQWHSHDYWELVYCTSGEGSFEFENGSILKYRTGDAIAIPPKELHTNVSHDGFTNIHLTMSDPSFSYRAAFRVNDDNGEHLKIAFAQAKYYYQSDIKKRELVLAALGELISSYMVVYRSNNEFSESVEWIRSEIIRNYSHADFQLDETIHSMPFHYDYLRKLFKKEIGMTPLEYMTNLRMKKAETMLTTAWTRDYSVSEIAELCGFDDALYFSRVFKKHFGCSPSAFAKEHTSVGEKAD